MPHQFAGQQRRISQAGRPAHGAGLGGLEGERKRQGHRAKLTRIKVTDITKSGSDIVLKFAGNFQGNPFDAAVTLTPDGTDKCKVTFDVNGGQFTMSGTGTKK